MVFDLKAKKPYAYLEAVKEELERKIHGLDVFYRESKGAEVESAGLLEKVREREGELLFIGAHDLRSFTYPGTKLTDFSRKARAMKYRDGCFQSWTINSVFSFENVWIKKGGTYIELKDDMRKWKGKPYINPPVPHSLLNFFESTPPLGANLRLWFGVNHSYYNQTGLFVTDSSEPGEFFNFHFDYFPGIECFLERIFKRTMEDKESNVWGARPRKTFGSVIPVLFLDDEERYVGDGGEWNPRRWHEFLERVSFWRNQPRQNRKDFLDRTKGSLSERELGNFSLGVRVDLDYVEEEGEIRSRFRRAASQFERMKSTYQGIIERQRGVVLRR